jgi:hypothetical protein
MKKAFNRKYCCSSGKKAGNKFKPLYKTIFYILVFSAVFFSSASINAQIPIEKIEGLPTKEIYDLHVDKKGYLWIAHGLGISRYDGLNFIHFTNPELADLRMTDIVEDRQGRIWCHNFSGQIFYIERGKLRFLESYDYKKENLSPRMALCGDELVVTSQSGLFVCSTTTLKGKYIPIEKTAGTAMISLSVTGNKAVIFNHINWYLYQQGIGIRKLDVDPSIQIEKGNTVSLQPISDHDTIFLITNPAGTLQKLVLQNDSIKRVAKIEYHDYINSITGDVKVWVNTRNKSMTIDGDIVIKDYNLTDIVTGKEGNTWYSSIKEGLLVSFKPSKWKKIKFPIDKEDFVRSLNVSDGYFFAGTQKGNLVVMKKDNSTPVWKHNMFNGYGSIDFIRFFKNHYFIVGTSTNTYIINPLQKKIESELPLKSIIDIDFDKNSLYVATPNGFYVLPFFDSSLSLPYWKIAKQQQYPFYNWNEATDNPYLIFPQRSQAIRFDKSEQSLFVSTKNGLQQVTQKGIQQFYINGKEVYASSLWYQNPRLYIATINDGLWIKENNSLQHFTTANYLFSNTIVRVKVTENHLWLLENNGIQVFDTNSDSILNHIDLPKIIGTDVFDVAEKNGYAYLTTANGIYKVPMYMAVEKRALFGYLDYVVVNNKDTLFKEDTNLSHDKNDIQFFFSSPAFYNPEAVSFKYRLIGDDDHWQVTKPNERMLRFSSLPPGVYTFEAMAVNRGGLQQEKPVSFHFVILKSWWNHWWFIILVNVCIVAIIFLIIRNRIDQRLKVELIRRGIASDLHDDIGATLSSINIYTEMAQEEMGENEYLEQIKENVNDTISRLDDLVWSINPKNDTMEQLMHRMQHTAVLLLEATGVQCHFNYDKKILNLKLNLADKRNVYLLFKEIVNNVIKHARSCNCYISIEYRHPNLILSVRDDGIGFDKAMVKKGRNGLESMRYRAKRMNGNVHINSSHKKGTNIIVQLKA